MAVVGLPGEVTNSVNSGYTQLASQGWLDKKWQDRGSIETTPSVIETMAETPVYAMVRGATAAMKKGKIGSSNVENPRFRHMFIPFGVPRLTVKKGDGGDFAANATTITVAGEDYIGGGNIVEGDATHLSPGMILRYDDFTANGGKGAVEFMKVKTVASKSSITVERNVITTNLKTATGETDSRSALSDPRSAASSDNTASVALKLKTGRELVIVGHEKPEGSKAVKVAMSQPTETYGYCQLFSASTSVTRTQEDSKTVTWTGGGYLQKSGAMADARRGLYQQVEHALIFGRRGFWTNSSNGEHSDVWTTAGLDYYCPWQHKFNHMIGAYKDGVVIPDKPVNYDAWVTGGSPRTGNFKVGTTDVAVSTADDGNLSEFDAYGAAIKATTIGEAGVQPYNFSRRTAEEWFADLDDMIRPVFRYSLNGMSSSRMVAMCGDEFMSKMNRMARLTNQRMTPLAPDGNKFGYTVNTFSGSFGELELVKTPLLSATPGWSNCAFIFNPKDYVVRVFRPLEYRQKDAKNFDEFQDRWACEYITQLGLQANNPLATARLRI